MSIPDMINGLFEITGGILICKSIVKLHEDRIVRGVHWSPVLFFAMWGYWNLYYYPHLNQPLSFLGGMCVTIANTIWMFQIIYYIKKEKK